MKGSMAKKDGQRPDAYLSDICHISIKTFHSRYRNIDLGGVLANAQAPQLDYLSRFDCQYEDESEDAVACALSYAFCELPTLGR